VFDGQGRVTPHSARILPGHDGGVEDTNVFRFSKLAGAQPPPPATTTSRQVFPDELESAPVNSGAVFSIAVVYQDKLTRIWAKQMCRPVMHWAAEERIQQTWQDVNSLSDPGILLEAVRAALAADVIVVSIHAADELPLDFYAWIDVWLPRRRSRAGALAALIGVAEPLDSRSVRTREYLQAVARRCNLDFIPQERRRPEGPTLGPGDSGQVLPHSATPGALDVEERLRRSSMG
jgi:hypothetical protein